MKVRYIPPQAESLNDVLFLEYAMKPIMAMARRHPSMREAFGAHACSDAGCTLCGSKTDVQIHHHTPVWATTVDYLLAVSPANYRQLGERAGPTCYKSFDFSPWHQTEQMTRLCRSCHEIHQAIDDRKWKIYLLEKYPVGFGVRWANGYMAGWGPRKDMTFQEFVAQYRAEQIAKLRSA